MTHLPPSTRLVDLHTDWLLQYALETTLYDPSLYQRVRSRFNQVEGYLQATSAAVLSCFRGADDWAAQTDPWAALDTLITRVEAEFAGRILCSQNDLQRNRDDADGLCQAVIGIEGFDFLIRDAADLERLRALFDRGVRLFQPTYTASSKLAGSSQPGDDRGLADLGRDFLEALAVLGPAPGKTGPRALVDLAHLNPRSCADILEWFEREPARLDRLTPVYSHGAPAHAGFDTPRALSNDNLTRLRALGGVVGFSVGPPFFNSPRALKAALEAAAELPFRGTPGIAGLAVGTDFMGVDQTLPELSNVEHVVSWIDGEFEPDTARSLIAGNARTLIELACGSPSKAT